MKSSLSVISKMRVSPILIAEEGIGIEEKHEKSVTKMSNNALIPLFMKIISRTLIYNSNRLFKDFLKEKSKTFTKVRI